MCAMFEIPSDWSSDVPDAVAYLLVTHGSRDPRSHQGAIALSRQLSPSPMGTAVLELGPVPLHQQVIDFVRQIRLPSGGRLRILPLFLLPGVHVMEDIPAEVALAKQGLGERVHLELLSYLGSQQSGMVKLLQQPGPGILIAHGSNRPGATAPVEALAKWLGLQTAYWVQPESLVERIAAIAQVFEENAIQDTGPSPEPRAIAILPYFLFEGAITDAIAERLKLLEPQFPELQLRLRPTLSEIPGFVHLVQQHLSDSTAPVTGRTIAG